MMASVNASEEWLHRTCYIIHDEPSHHKSMFDLLKLFSCYALCFYRVLCRIMAFKLQEATKPCNRDYNLVEVVNFTNACRM